MRRVALATLRHDALRTSLLVAGLAAAWSLVAVQLGLRRGFELSSRAVVDHVGGDVWIAARGVRVVDDGEPVTLGSFQHACVVSRRSVIVDYTQARHPDGSLVTVQLVGIDASTRERVPWGVVGGSAKELADVRSAGIDAADAEKLGLARDGLAQTITLRDASSLRVAVVSRGARSFTQTPYVFVDVATARKVLSLPDDAATFWALDLRERGCTDEVVAAARATNLGAHSREALAASTTEHWVQGSGIGLLLSAGTIIAALVAAAVLAQSAVTIVRTHVRELATILALGARRSELAAFVAWQVGVVSILAASLGLGLASLVAQSLESTGLAVVVDYRTWLGGFGIVVASTALAAGIGARVLGRLDPTSVLE